MSEPQLDLGVKPLDVEPEQELTDELIPKPVGYHVLIAMPQIEDTYDGVILKTSQTQHHDSILSMVGLVLDMGDQAYNDEERFPTGPWCTQGDFVMFRANTGTRFKVGKNEYRLMNDDSIQAVVTDPNAIQRVS